MQVKPENMGYEPDGPVGMALCFLRGALGCEAFKWDADQHEYAAKSSQDAEVWLKSTIARLATYEAALREAIPLLDAYANRCSGEEFKSRMMEIDRVADKCRNALEAK